MQCRRLQPTEPPVRQFVEELWLPYHRELERTVDAHVLDDSVGLVEEEIAFRLEWLDAEDHEIVVAEREPDGERRDGDRRLAGFVATERRVAPSVFDQPDRLVVDDIFVRERERGSGLARRLVDRASQRASALDCTELELDVDVDNERAIAFYEKLGFEPYRRTMTAPVEEL